MSKWGWFSADVDTGEVVAKTEVHDNGSVSRYDYTEPDDISAGHGHKEYGSMDDFMSDKPSWERNRNDPASQGRDWYGNG